MGPESPINKISAKSNKIKCEKHFRKIPNL